MNAFLENLKYYYENLAPFWRNALPLILSGFVGFITGILLRSLWPSRKKGDASLRAELEKALEDRSRLAKEVMSFRQRNAQAQPGANAPARPAPAAAPSATAPAASPKPATPATPVASTPAASPARPAVPPSSPASSPAVPAPAPGGAAPNPAPASRFAFRDSPPSGPTPAPSLAAKPAPAPVPPAKPTPVPTAAPAPIPAAKPTPIPAAAAPPRPGAPSPIGSGDWGAFLKDLQAGLAQVGPLGLVYKAAPAQGDDFSLIQGIDPALSQQLRELGIHRFSQISRWTGPIIEEVRKAIPAAGRILEDKWVAQALRLEQLQAEGKPLSKAEA